MLCVFLNHGGVRSVSCKLRGRPCPRALSCAVPIWLGFLHLSCCKLSSPIPRRSAPPGTSAPASCALHGVYRVAAPHLLMGVLRAFLSPHEPWVSTRTRPVALVPAWPPASQALPPLPAACVRGDREKPCRHPGKERAPCWNLKEGAGGGETRSHPGAPAPGQLCPCTVPFACHGNAVGGTGSILSRAPGALRWAGLSWVLGLAAFAVAQGSLFRAPRLAPSCGITISVAAHYLLLLT